MRKELKILLLYICICVLCCSNTVFADVDTLSWTNGIMDNQGHSIAIKEKVFGITELRDELNNVKQSCENQYSNYLTRVSFGFALIGLFITVLVAVVGIIIPLSQNKRYKREMEFRIKNHIKKIDKKIKKFDADYNIKYSELQTKIEEHDTLIKLMAKKYEKKSKLSLPTSSDKNNNKQVKTILLNNKYNILDKIELLNSLLRKEPDNIDALITRGVYYFDLNDFVNSKEDFEKAKELASKTMSSYYEAISCNNLGVVFNDLGKYKQAISLFNIAINREPKYALAYHNRAYSYRYDGKKEDAIKDCLMAISLDDTFADAYNSLASIYRDKQDDDNTLKFLRISEGLDEKNPWTYNGWAKWLISKGMYDKAYGKSLRALMYDSRPELYDTCVEALMKMNNYEKAIEMCEKGLGKNPNKKTRILLEKKRKECIENLYCQTLNNDIYYE